MLARDINHLIDILEEIIEDAKNNQSPMGYFPALYRKVTIDVKNKIEDGYFDDGPRMERLDVGFANRYLSAYDNFKLGNEITRSWQLAFKASKDPRPIVLQHLFLGMSAHINLDLGIVASEISPGAQIHTLQNDFNKINAILGGLVNDVQKELSKIWPMLKVIDWVAGSLDEAVANFSIDIARDRAWEVATDLSVITDASQKKAYITDLDNRVYGFGHKLYKPGWILSMIIRIIRITERGDVAKRIRYLR